MGSTWTYTRSVDLWHPDPDVVDVLDIAHSLSMTCRFGGHCREHYSVAEHSLLVMNLAMLAGDQSLTPAESLAALLHDAAEAYVGDLNSELKARLPQYRELEDGWLAAIYRRFGCRIPERPDLIHEADMRARGIELVALYDVLPQDGRLWPEGVPIPSMSEYGMVRCLGREEARRSFLAAFYALRDLVVGGAT